jgi:hypothetical protein
MKQSEQIIDFISALSFKGRLPKGINILNPFKDNASILPIAEEFYTKYYNDSKQRTLVLGINPGRLGAGATGIPFTDTKRMAEYCGIVIPNIVTHEPSSVFVYEMITAFGGVENFYNQFYISSICPLGFTAAGAQGKEVNYNYYDSAALTKAVTPFMVQCMQQQLDFGLNREVVYVFGTGKNFAFVDALNAKHKWFKKVVPLEHPRYIMQYKARLKQDYITKYLEAFNTASL